MSCIGVIASYVILYDIIALDIVTRYNGLGIALVALSFAIN
jgi:hypothetical protein